MGILSKLVALSAISNLAAAWLPETNKKITAKNGTNLFTPSKGKIRGVNLGTQFIFEPWIAEQAWGDMGCGETKSEFDCVDSLGQEKANDAFAKHWETWTTEDDIAEIVSYGLNTIRIPVGYWLKEDLVDKQSEHFPQGGLDYVKKLCGWASDAGLYIIMDLHGAPAAQTPKNAFTGQMAPDAGFYEDKQYERALQWLEWMTDLIHKTTELRNVGMLELVNEPVQDEDKASSMREKYYPQAWKRIRDAESKSNVAKENYVHIQMMDKLWGSGDPNEHLDDKTYAAYDDHRYFKWDTSIDQSHDAYIDAACKDKRDSNTPTIVGEWSLAVPSDVESSSDWDPDSNADFYKKWFAAQVRAYEQGQGWVFWTWKAQLDDIRWSYQDAVDKGIVPKDLNSLESPCS